MMPKAITDVLSYYISAKEDAMRRLDLSAAVAETLDEQRRIREYIDTAVLKGTTSILISFGMDEDDRREMRSDFQYLRRWRKSVEQAQNYTCKAAITIVVTGFVGAAWLGIKFALGKGPLP
jgi:hypothetical protein